MNSITVMVVFALACVRLFGAQTDIHVTSTAQTNAENATAYVKNVYTRNGQTNLISITKVNTQGVLHIARFYHEGHLIGNFVAFPQESTFNTEASPYCMSLKYGPSGEIRLASIGDKDGAVLDEFTYTNGVFAPVEGPLKQIRLMKPKFSSETDVPGDKER